MSNMASTMTFYWSERTNRSRVRTEQKGKQNDKQDCNARPLINQLGEELSTTEPTA